MQRRAFLLACLMLAGVGSLPAQTTRDPYTHFFDDTCPGGGQAGDLHFL